MSTPTENNDQKKLLTSNHTYDIIKDSITLGIPGVTAFYAGMAILWGWPFAEQIVGSGALLATGLGVFLKIAGKRYETSIQRLTDSAAAVDANVHFVQNPEDSR